MFIVSLHTIKLLFTCFALWFPGIPEGYLVLAALLGLVFGIVVILGLWLIKLKFVRSKLWYVLFTLPVNDITFKIIYRFIYDKVHMPLRHANFSIRLIWFYICGMRFQSCYQSNFIIFFKVNENTDFNVNKLLSKYNTRTLNVFFFSFSVLQGSCVQNSTYNIPPRSSDTEIPKKPLTSDVTVINTVINKVPYFLCLESAKFKYDLFLLLLFLH